MSSELFTAQHAILLGVILLVAYWKGWLKFPKKAAPVVVAPVAVQAAPIQAAPVQRVNDTPTSVVPVPGMPLTYLDIMQSPYSAEYLFTVAHQKARFEADGDLARKQATAARSQAVNVYTAPFMVTAGAPSQPVPTPAPTT